MILKNESPDDYRTRPVRVRFDGRCYHVEPFGEAYDFATMRTHRQPLELSSLPDTGQPFELELANLGVSVWLKVSIKGKDYLVLVFQRRDRGDQVLKLVSGYVPAEHLHNPEAMMLQEIAEEVLLQTTNGFCRFSLDGAALPWPYLDLQVDAESAELIREKYTLAGNQQWSVAGEPAEVTAYIDTNVAALQLIYAYSMVLPESVINGKSAEDELVDGLLITQLDPECELVFAGLNQSGKPNGEYYNFRDGRLKPVDCSNASLSEAFVPRKGIFVSQSSIKVCTLSG